VTWNDRRPVLCRLCGEPFPATDALWEHSAECPELDREVERIRRAERPTLLSHRQIAHAVDRFPLSNPWRRLLAFGIRQIAPDATLYDALRRMSPREAERWARWLGRPHQA
jgi:hypothetical protein